MYKGQSISGLYRPLQVGALCRARAVGADDLGVHESDDAGSCQRRAVGMMGTDHRGVGVVVGERMPAGRREVSGSLAGQSLWSASMLRVARGAVA